MNKKLICPQCQEKKYLMNVKVEHSKHKITIHSMCLECFEHFQKIFKNGYPKIYRSQH